MRALAWAGLSLLALLILTCVLLVRGTSLPWLTDRLTAYASAYLDREVRIGSAPYVKVGNRLQIRLRDVQVANVAWAGDEPLAELDEADVVLNAGSLFGDGPLVAERILVDGLRLRLARDENGDSNLPQVLTAETSETEDAEEQESPSGSSFVLRELDVSNVRLERSNQALDTQLDLRIASLRQQEGADGGLLLDARGSLQGEAWSVSGSNSGLESLIKGEGLEGRAQARMADLSLDFDYRLASVRHLEDLVLNLRLAGPLPERVAELSPLLSANEILLIDAVISDIDPGIGIEAVIDLGDTELRIDGSADDPATGDGLNLSFDVDATSVAEVARALGLGSVTDGSLTIDGDLRRHERRLEVENLAIQTGEHRIEGRVLIPQLPGTTDARATLNAQGPDFGFYQRLLRRPFAINAPYQARVAVENAADGRDAVEASVIVGETRVRASGVLGDFPSYRNSQLTLSADVADPRILGPPFDRLAPEVPLSIKGDVEVTTQGRVLLPELRARSAGIEAILSGGLNSYPELDDIDLTIRASTPSLAQSSLALQGPALGDVPASFSAAVRGSVANIIVDTIKADVGESQVRTLSGDVRVAGSSLRSDLHLSGTVQSLTALLANLEDSQAADETAAADRDAEADVERDTRGERPIAKAVTEAITEPRREFKTPLLDRPLSFELITELTPDRIALTMTQLQGVGVKGDLRWQSAPDFALDESMQLSADLLIENPAELIPTINGYTPPSASLVLRADTTVSPRRITATLTGAGAELLAMELIPRSGDVAAKLSVRGQGPDLRSFGEVAAFPAGALPYRIEASARLDREDYAIGIDELSIAGTSVTGTARWQPEPKTLTARLDVPQAALGVWLPSKDSDADASPRSGNSETGKSPSRKQRVIPATPLPVAWLDRGKLDIAITTGSLGLPDPLFSDRSLVERADLSLVSGDGRATLQINELRGSRGNLVLSAEAQRTAEGARLTTDWQVEGLTIGMLSGTTDASRLPRQEIKAHFTGQGSTTRELANTLTGELLLQGREGELNNLSLSLVTESFLQQLAGTLLPVLKTDTPSLKVQCSVVGLRAEQGIVALDPGFVIRTDRVDLSARGAVDLSTERLTVRFDNQARKGLGISAASLVNPYVQITGTLARPLIGLDITSSALAGGAAVATGGLTILAKPLFGRFLQRKSPCDIALERWEKGATGTASGP